MSKVIGKISGWDRLRFRGTVRLLAHAAGRPVVHLSSPGVCKEDVAREIQAKDRG